MNRRGFLAGMFASAMAPAIVRAESIMRIKSIVLPGEAEFAAVAASIPVAGNQFVSAAMIAKESLAILEDCLRFMENQHPEYDSKPGRQRIKIRRPPAYRVSAQC